MSSLELIDLYQRFRDPDTIKAYQSLIYKEALKIKKTINIMEVCGGHTHAIMKYGLNQLMPRNINFIHGPGCPVCVLSRKNIDQAYVLALQKDIILVTLGDMLKAIGTNGSLQDARKKGADVRFVYSPLDCIKIANENKNKTVIFFAVGFETTTPMTSTLIDQVIKKSISNLLFHINHVTIPEAMEHLLSNRDNKIDAFIAPSHVSVISGSKIYEKIATTYQKPILVSGFEPVDIMESIFSILKLMNTNSSKVQIQYSRSVNRNGNEKAQKLNNKYFDKKEFVNFRGIGKIKYGGVELKKQFCHLDAKIKYQKILPQTSSLENPLCICGDILAGRSHPYQCQLFKKLCTPTNPIGSCMVSSEGACAAYFKYGGVL